MASSPSSAAPEAPAPAPTFQNDAGATVAASTVAGSTNPSSTMTVESADVVRLIEAYLTENGLHDSCTRLREESGILGAGVSHRLFQLWARQGKWGTILESLSTMDESYMTTTAAMDGENLGNSSCTLMADVHEMAILELGDVGETELAYAALRLVADELDRTSTSSKEYNDNNAGGILRIPRSRLLEQKLAALASYRASSAGDEQRRTATPSDYYAAGGGSSSTVMTQQARREEIGKRLADSVPIVPSSRLVTLLQQSIKWQAHTGLLPTKIQQQLKEEEDEELNDKDDKKKKKKKHKKRKRKEFNLVLGEVDVPSSLVGEQTATAAAEGGKEAAMSQYAAEPIPYKTHSTIKFGKKATAESTLFLPDASGLVTGSSDGLIEIWDSSQKYAKLQNSSFQEKDEFMWHDHPVLALAVSNDGQMLASGDLQGNVKVWKIESGTCLREFRAHEKSSISSLCFSNDGSRVLTASHDNTCREFGLRTSHMLKEFRGHTSYVNACCYHLGGGNGDNDRLYVLTASADGTIRVWDGKTAETLKVLMPRDGVSSAIIDSSSAVGGGESGSGDVSGGGPSIHSLIPLHKVPNGFLVVPRGPKAFIVTLEGAIIKSFDTGEGKVIIAATVSPSNLWFYAVTEDGVCFVFDLVSGKIEQSLRNFALESTYNSSSHTKQQDGSTPPPPPEISTIIHHPHKGILATFSNDKGQKRGLLTLWK